MIRENSAIPRPYRVTILICATLSIVGFCACVPAYVSDHARTEFSIGEIVDALEQFHTCEGRYPTQSEGLTILLEKSKCSGEPLLAEERYIIDEWGRKYIYEREEDGRSYTISTMGRDGIVGGKRRNSDLDSDMLGITPVPDIP